MKWNVYFENGDTQELPEEVLVYKIKSLEVSPDTLVKMSKCGIGKDSEKPIFMKERQAFAMKLRKHRLGLINKKGIG